MLEATDMKAIVQDRYGSHEVLEERTIERPRSATTRSSSASMRRPSTLATGS